MAEWTLGRRSNYHGPDTRCFLGSGAGRGMYYCVLCLLHLCYTGLGHAALPIETPKSLDLRNTSWTQENYPNPQLNVDRCGRQGRPSWVCDPAAILSTSQADELDWIIKKTQNDTSCQCGTRCGSHYVGGYRIGVAILNRLVTERGSGVSREGEAQHLGQEFADHLRTYSWRFGLCQDDLVVVYSKHENQVFTSVGRVARDVLKGSCESHINGQVDKEIADWIGPDHALVDLVASYSDVLTGHRKCQATWGILRWWHVLLVCALIVLLFVFLLLLAIKIMRQRPQCCLNAH